MVDSPMVERSMIINLSRLGVLALAMLLWSCGGREQASPSSQGAQPQAPATASEHARQGSDWSNPFAALGELARLGQQLEQAAEDLDTFTPVDPVSFRELINQLPNPPLGWERTEPEGATTSMGEFRISQAEATYRQGDRQIQISLIDSAYNPALYAPFLIAASFSQESTSGFDRGLTFGSHPGRESYTNASRSGMLAVLVERRFIVEISGSDIDANELRRWWDRLNTGQLRGMARP